MKNYRKTGLLQLLAISAQLVAFEMAAQSAEPEIAGTPQLRFTVDAKERKFSLSIENKTRRSCYLQTQNKKLWCYYVEVWDRLRVGYRLDVKEAVEASENGASR